jgi:hypothetical protein
VIEAAVERHLDRESRVSRAERLLAALERVRALVERYRRRVRVAV